MPSDGGHGAGEHRLADARHVLDQQMPLAQHGDDDQLDRVALADDDALDIRDQALGQGLDGLGGHDGSLN